MIYDQGMKYHFLKLSIQILVVGKYLSQTIDYRVELPVYCGEVDVVKL